MADVRRSRDAAIGRCRKHPWHQQSPGVCSLCLGDRLSRLSASSSGKKTSSRRASESSSSPSSVSTHYSSDSDSSYCPTPSRRQHHGRVPDEAKSGPLLLSALFGGGKDGNLKKSRSMAADTVTKVAGEYGKDEKLGSKKLVGFWSKLVHRRRRKRRESDNNGLKRPGTTAVREKVTT